MTSASTITIAKPGSIPVPPSSAPFSASRPTPQASTPACQSINQATTEVLNLSQSSIIETSPDTNDLLDNASTDTLHASTTILNAQAVVANVTVAAPSTGAITAASVSPLDCIDSPAPVRRKWDVVLKWFCDDWEMKLLALLALVWGIRAFNEQIRGNNLNEMEACRNHPNDPALQATDLCVEMRNSGDFDVIVKRAIRTINTTKYSNLGLATFCAAALSVASILRRRRRGVTCFRRSGTKLHGNANGFMHELHEALLSNFDPDELYALGDRQKPSDEDIRRAIASSQRRTIWRSMLSLITYWHYEYYELGRTCPAHISLLRRLRPLSFPIQTVQEARVLTDESVRDSHMWIAVDLPESSSGWARLRTAETYFVSHQIAIPRTTPPSERTHHNTRTDELRQRDQSRQRGWILYLQKYHPETTMRTKLLVLKQCLSLTKFAPYAAGCIVLYLRLEGSFGWEICCFAWLILLGIERLLHVISFRDSWVR